VWGGDRILMDNEIQYEDILVYVARIREANEPLGILLNVDYLTDILDIETNELEVLKRYGIKTHMVKLYNKHTTR
jgi:hypothetical protein